MDNDYTKSTARCPLCGKVIGCVEKKGEIFCDLKKLAKHVRECRKRVKPLKENPRIHDSPEASEYS